MAIMMLSRRSLVPAVAGFIAFVIPLVAIAADGRFTPLFNGNTFDGWEGDLKSFRIQDGAIVGGDLTKRLPANEYLCTKKSYADFELRLKCKLLGEHANGGVQIRSQRVPKSREMVGYQADIGISLETNPLWFWGCLFDHHGGGKGVVAGPAKEEQMKLIHVNDWNDYRILCEGRRVQLWLNGRKTADYTEPNASLPQVGILGLQIHNGPPAEAWYKDIMIREVPAK
jgi:hypothetical protein